MSGLSQKEREARLQKIEELVDAFAYAMKAAMVANLDKTPWEELPTGRLLGELTIKLGYLSEELLGKGLGGKVGLVRRAVDLANFAMMLSDNAAPGFLEPPPPAPGRALEDPEDED